MILLSCMVFNDNRRFDYTALTAMANISTLTYLRFQIGGYDATKFEVILNRKTVTYFADIYRFDEGDKHKKKIPSDDLELFITKLNEIKVYEWNDEYVSDTLDGEQWELKLSYNDKKKKSIYGSNCYPNSKPDSDERTKTFNNFMDALVHLIQESKFFTDSFLNKTQQ